MKKSMVLSAGLCAVLMLASCGTKDSAYRKAYDKAKAAEAEAALTNNNTEVTETPVVTPVQTTTTEYTQTTVTDNVDNVAVETGIDSIMPLNTAPLANDQQQ